MKKTIILLLIAIISASCLTDSQSIEDENILEETLYARGTADTLIDIVDEESLETTALRYTLKIYSYAFARVLLKNQYARYQVMNSVSGNTIDLNQLLLNQTFKNAMIAELTTMHNSIPSSLPALIDENGNPIKGSIGSSTIRPKVPLNELNANQAYPYIIEAIESNNLHNCLEVYLARTFDYSDNTIHISPHPLNNDSYTIGYSLFTENGTDNGFENITFDDTFLSNHLTNIFIIRPVRTSTCNYNFINVNDFTNFY